jgi:hypothetical protein
MATTKPDPPSVEDVRRWRKEAYDARQKLSDSELAAHDQQVADQLGLANLPVLKPGKDSRFEPRPRRSS